MKPAQFARWVRDFCENRLEPAAFEARFYGDAHQTALSLLKPRSPRWGLPVKVSPYVDLLEVDIRADPGAAREILRRFLVTLELPKPTAADVAEAERRLGCKLPIDYLDFLTSGQVDCFSGGFLEVPRPVSPDVGRYLSEGRCVVEEVWGISLDARDPRSVLQTLHLAPEWDLPADLVLLSGDGHTWHALDYRGGGARPTVSFVVSRSGESVSVASSFREWLASIEPLEGGTE